MCRAEAVRLFLLSQRGRRLSDCGRAAARGLFCEVTKVPSQQQRWLTLTKVILTLPLTKTVAEPVRGHDEEHLIGSAAISVNAEASLFLFQAVRSQF